MWLSCIPWSNNTMKQEFPISFGNDDESWRLLYQYFLLIKKLWSFLIAKASWCLEPRELKLKFGCNSATPYAWRTFVSQSAMIFQP
ncbi:hypothetical protein K7X08_015269 [Anisodus acutangulus]|uniref:Uncharacterized protein n=1 Tax=Anisodus acutangulus TaxID=402998 RepID=A0A9Q1QUD8_9SOLA|nr:hypothetical protein K7X08_015269 [Anisodus acutangulus]